MGDIDKVDRDADQMDRKRHEVYHDLDKIDRTDISYRS